MKKTFLLITILLVCSFAAFSQNCAPDGTVPADFIGISPLADSTEPCDTIIPAEVAFIGAADAYETTITVFIPAEVGGFSLVDVSLDPATGITGLPAGLSYACEPANCIFAAGVPGCVKISGNLDAAVTPGLNDLLITATVNAGILAGEVRFPLPDNEDDYTTIENLLGGAGFSFPECPYQIQVSDPSPTEDLINTQLSVSQNKPNPFTGVTNIELVAEAGDYNFAIFNTVGEKVHNEVMTLNGESVIEYDASALTAGVYFYSFSNENGNITRRMIVQ